MTNGISFQGITSGVQTDPLVSAIMAQNSLPLVRLQKQQSLNTARQAALTSMQTDMTALANSLQTLQYTGSGFDARAVTSSDPQNAHVTATAAGVAPGSYEVQVSTVATQGRIAPALDGLGNPTLATSDPSGAGTSQVFTPGAAPARFAIQGTDGVVKVITLNDGNNSLNGLQSAINASGAGVTASIVNTGTGAKPYQLVLTAKDTGTGTTGGVVTLADLTGNDGTSVGNLLGIQAGTVDSLAAPTAVSGGLRSAAATDAVFSVNGLLLTRKTNQVTDAVSGLTLKLTQGQQAAATIFTVSGDKGAITLSMQDVISKFNTLATNYKAAATATRDASGNIVPAPLSSDPTARRMLAQVRAALTGIPAGLPASATFKSTGDLGITGNPDGTLTLDAAAFQKALDQDPDGAKRVFAFTGSTSNGVVGFSQGAAHTTALNVAFTVTGYDGNTGGWSGTLAADGGAPVAVTGTKDGQVAGVEGTSMEGLRLSVTGTGTGTLSLTKGAAQSTQDLVASLTSYQGLIWNTQQTITQTNANLDARVKSRQVLLYTQQKRLKQRFAEMEASVSQLRTASGGLAGA